MNYTDLLVRCPRCRKPCFLTYGEASYRNLALFEAKPWSPDDELPLERMTEAALKRWRAQLAHKLYICYIDFERGTWQVAAVRSSDKLRFGQPLWKPHNCLVEEDGDGVVPKKTDLVPDRPAVAMDAGERRPAVAGGHIRRRSSRIGARRTGGV